MGAFIALKEAPRNAWIESWVAYGGPFVGALGALACLGLFFVSGNPVFRALAYSGFFLNLFNLIPFGFLDGGRIVTAISPWITLVGVVLIGAMLIFHPSFLLILIVLMSLPRVFSLFRRRSAAEERWYEVTGLQRLVMSTLYFGLIGALVLGMALTHFTPAS
jgi:Zn-dependent protease